jgi:hypothetical protein
MLGEFMRPSPAGKSRSIYSCSSGFPGVATDPSVDRSVLDTQQVGHIGATAA